MPEQPTPTTLRRQLGAHLRQLRQGNSMTAQQVADALGSSLSKISRMESGARAVSELDIEALIELFAVPEDRASQLVELARAGRRRRDPAATVPAPEIDHQAFVRSGFVELERDADVVREFNAGFVPGLLQDPAYIRSLMLSSVPVDDSVLARAVDLRLRRQARLDQKRDYTAIVDEAVLARVTGGRGVMRQQMDSLLQRIDKSEVDFRVVPFEAGPHPALNSMFVMLTMFSAGLPNVVFSEGLAGYSTFERAEELERFERAWDELLTLSASAVDSRALVISYRTAYS